MRSRMMNGSRTLTCVLMMLSISRNSMNFDFASLNMIMTDAGSVPLINAAKRSASQMVVKGTMSIKMMDKISKLRIVKITVSLRVGTVNKLNSFSLNREEESNTIMASASIAVDVRKRGGKSKGKNPAKSMPDKMSKSTLEILSVWERSD